MQCLLDQLQPPAAGSGRGTGRRSARRCKNNRGDGRSQADGLRGIAGRLAITTLAGVDNTPAAVGVAILGIQLDRQLEVTQRQFRCIDHQMHPAAVCLHGRSRAATRGPS